MVEDNDNLGSVLKEYLEAKDFIIEKAKNGKEVYDLFHKQKYDLCLLNVSIPLKDNFTLVKEIKVRNKNMPLIFLTANSTMEDTIEGFNVGADDYITKPMHLEELLTRIHAVLRRSMKIQMPNNISVGFSVGKYIFNADTQTILLGEDKRKLTTKETQLLNLLVFYKNELLIRSFALKMIWHENNSFNVRSMDVYITKLRKYLKGDPKVKIINIHGKGFKLLVNP